MNASFEMYFLRTRWCVGKIASRWPVDEVSVTRGEAG